MLPTFTKILCPTDFSAGSEQAVRVGIRLARETGAELVLVHAWYVPPLAYSHEVAFPAYMEQEMIDDSQRALDAAVREAAASGAKYVSGKLLNGTPWLEIVTQLETEAFDLCVIGTHGRTGLSRILLGSVAENVVRHAPCSVLAVRPDGEARPFRHVLVPTDFSESAEHALDLAATLVEPTGSITLLHVIESLAAYSKVVAAAYSSVEPVADFARDLEEHADAALDKEIVRLKRATNVAITAQSRHGSPGAQALAALDDNRSIDLVAMGSHGRTGIKRALMGSVAEKVVRHARCPVLVARKRA